MCSIDTCMQQPLSLDNMFIHQFHDHTREYLPIYRAIVPHRSATRTQKSRNPSTPRGDMPIQAALRSPPTGSSTNPMANHTGKKEEPGTTDQTRQNKTRQGKSRQDKARKGKARQGETMQGKTRQSKGGQGNAMQDKARRGKTGQCMPK